MKSSAMSMAAAWLVLMTTSMSCQHHEPVAQRVFETGPIHWGQPVNGLQVGLAVKKQVSGPEDLAWRPANFEFYLRNVGQEPIRIIEPVVTCQPPASAGRPLVDARFTPQHEPTYRIGLFGSSDPIRAVKSLAPGEVLSIGGQNSMDLRIDPGFWGLAAPVEGECVFSYHNSSPAGELAMRWDKTETVDGLWTGDAESAPMRIRFAGLNEPPASEP